MSRLWAGGSRDCLMRYLLLSLFCFVSPFSSLLLSSAVAAAAAAAARGCIIHYYIHHPWPFVSILSALSTSSSLPLGNVAFTPEGPDHSPPCLLHAPCYVYIQSCPSSRSRRRLDVGHGCPNVVPMQRSISRKSELDKINKTPPMQYYVCRDPSLERSDLARVGYIMKQQKKPTKPTMATRAAKSRGCVGQTICQGAMIRGRDIISQRQVATTRENQRRDEITG